jgi:hypothetical protein
VGAVGTVDGDNLPPTGSGVSCSRSGVAQRIGVGEGGGRVMRPVAPGTVGTMPPASACLPALPRQLCEG